MCLLLNFHCISFVFCPAPRCGLRVLWEGDVGDFLHSVTFSQKRVFIPLARPVGAEDAAR